MPYVAEKVLFHHGARVFPGDVVADAEQWQNFKTALERGYFRWREDVDVGEVAQVKELLSTPAQPPEPPAPTSLLVEATPDPVTVEEPPKVIFEKPTPRRRKVRGRTLRGSK